jgi:hypothetical protein
MNSGNFHNILSTTIRASIWVLQREVALFLTLVLETKEQGNILVMEMTNSIVLSYQRLTRLISNHAYTPTSGEAATK